jgi:hypothetical protein
MLPLVEVTNGSGWATQPTTTKGSKLEDVSCVSATSCTAVSSYPLKTGLRLLVEHWNGVEWTNSLVAPPSKSTSSWLHAVSCTAPAACTAVGAHSKEGDGGIPALLVYAGNATEGWSLKEAPSPMWGAGATTALAPHGVSCTGDGACTIVGSYTNEAGVEVPFSEAY